MILSLFRREDARRRAIERLHIRINEASRAPGLYTVLGVPDTVEGRFESLSLHIYLVLRRLRALPPPADEVAQDLVNSVFAQLDASLRELGVGDVGVPKRMKKLGAAFYGRTSSYDAGLDASDAREGEPVLAGTLARNVLGRDDPAAAEGLARYVRASARALDAHELDALLSDGPAFPPPGIFDAQRSEA